MKARVRKSKFPQHQTQKKSGLTPTVLIVATLVVLAGLLIYAAWQTIQSRSEASRPIEGVEQFLSLSRNHQEGRVAYDQTPPVGGIHNPVPQNCGVYTEPIATENAVHSLEHGAIWITYRPDLPSADVTQLQALTRQSSHRLLSPYPELPSPIVVSAWGYQLKLERAGDPRLLRFIQQYERNPFSPEPSAACSGGIGQVN